MQQKIVKVLLSMELSLRHPHAGNVGKRHRRSGAEHMPLKLDIMLSWRLESQRNECDRFVVEEGEE